MTGSSQAYPSGIRRRVAVVLEIKKWERGRLDVVKVRSELMRREVLHESLERC